MNSTAVYQYLVRISDNVDTFIAGELRRRGYPGLTRSHLEILSLLHRFPTLTLSEIARKIERSKPTVTVLVRKLVSQGFCKRHANSHDARSVYISLSARGRKTKRAIFSIYVALGRLTSTRVNPTELETLKILLMKLYGKSGGNTAAAKNSASP